MPKLLSTKLDETKDNKVIALIDKLTITEVLTKNEYLYILDNITSNTKKHLFNQGLLKKQIYYQNRVYLRGLIEISNYCKKGCLYCGINNKMEVERYRLDIDEIINTAKEGYNLGYRTFVIQGGEDSYYQTKMIVKMLKSIKDMFKDIRITLSLGERSYEDYQAFYDAGADRYLLRHEAASKKLYEHLHPDYMSYDNRINCLKNLKEIGYQVGAGFMVGSPTQNNEDLVEDLLFLKSLNPHMVGIGPYLCHSDTVFKGSSSGTLDETLVMVALTRLILPKTLLPSTTALGSLSPIGREKALKVGANVLMPNISPTEHRIKYEIYQDKICVTDTSDQCRNCIEGRVVMIDHEIDLGVGDALNFEGKK
ncbi:[FeFe] hydrogenase H-cluster radical SAM maturase HydE [Candidatus Izimaplasma bacterium ZiA1]|uniref:[FeFe] hydrogenase H-cluster radical SAM maturase HydE n=1 Tax=Candidatus Izimoplasma sp. ZiA1 TaxID=2024899 RepID=UPI000BAA6BDA|nr:[FeFe] hydrogenase H-cluster radical SAM maturase HydE [Candidatus Izimaplasma bacterium ZiA1]